MIKIESRLEEFANLYGCRFSKEKFELDSTFGFKADMTVMNLQYNYTDINASYEFGNHNIAEFNFDLDTTRNIPEFEVTTVEHFFRIFSLFKNPWKIKSKNRLTTASVNDCLNKSGMTDFARKVAFSPTITGKYLNGRFNCKTQFHLGFDDKEESFKPSMEFQKILIDRLRPQYCG